MNTIQNRLLEIFNKYDGDKTAIEYGEKSITYKELHKKSNMIANCILESKISKGSLIGIFMDDKIGLILTVIGILKAGCVFVPLDPGYPDIRLSSMINSTGTKIIFTDEHNDERIKRLFTAGARYFTVFNLDDIITGNISADNPSIRYLPEDMIYIYFTSGTTGKPNAIAGQNKSLAHFIDWEIETFGITEDYNVSQFTSQCHDPFLRDIFVPLCSGSKVCIPENRDVLLSTARLCNWIEKSRVNLIHCTPGVFRIFSSGILTPASFPELKYILLAGEKIIPPELSNWYDAIGDRIQLVNLYGPTETTLAKLFYMIKPEDVQRRYIPIGKPITGTKAIVLDKYMKVCGQGEIGEIYIRTKYRTLGYYNNPELTALRFIPNPFSNNPDDIIYRTGDLGRVLPDGNIEFIGRADKQVKIRGFRVELDEVEQEMSKYPGIGSCVVDFKELPNSLGIGNEVSFCNRCGLPSTYSDTVIDSAGKCNMCNLYEEIGHKAASYFGSLDELRDLLIENRTDKKSEYDCIMLYSGGKDSTYALYKLVDMGIKVLAYVFDNGFISDVAIDNIKKITAELNVDLLIDSFEGMNHVFRKGLIEENSVCNGCFKVLRIRSTKLAYEKGIKNIVTGFSRGQIYELRLQNILMQGIFNISDIEEKIFEQRVLYHGKKDYVTDVMESSSEITAEMLNNVRLIDFYRYTDVTKEQILSYLMQKSSFWTNPSDTGVCSSNCVINDVGIYMQRKKLGYDNYTCSDSWEVRIGHIPLDEVKKRYESKIDLHKIKNILMQLGYDENIDQIDYQGGYLAAYYTAAKDIDARELYSYLEQRLPDYAIPSFFVRLNELPLTLNGKIDYNSLPDPRKIESKKDFIAPRDYVEKKLAEIWCEILNIRNVGIDDNFLRIGGHSLNIMSMVSKVYKAFGVELPLGEIFENATIEKLALFIKKSDAFRQDYNEYTGKRIEEYKNINFINPDTSDSIKIIQNINPFNDVFFKSCFFNAFFPIVIHYGKSVIPFMANDAIIYQYDKEKEAVRFGIDFICEKTSEELLLNEEINVNRKRPGEDIVDELIASIRQNKPVVIGVDCFYEPIRKDMYLKHNWPHSLLVYGYDHAKQLFNVIEHRKINSLSYRACNIGYSDIFKAYNSFMDKFDGKSNFPSYLEFSSEYVQSIDYNALHKDRFRNNFVNSVLAQADMVVASVETLKDIAENFKEITLNKNLLEDCIKDLSFTLTTIVNAKKCVRYIVSNLFEEHGNINELLDSIVRDWLFIRDVVEKFELSSRYREESFIEAYTKFSEIYEHEKNYCDIIKSSLYKISINWGN